MSGHSLRKMILVIALLSAALLAISILPAGAQSIWEREIPGELNQAQPFTPEEVREIQQILADLGFYVIPVDGDWGPATESAIMGFHKALGVERTTIWRPQDYKLAEYWVPRLPDRPDQPNRLEVDITSQIMHLIEDGQRVATLNISSGEEGANNTPRGSYTLFRRINGYRYAPLGVLYKPWYFWEGYALHGSTSVPDHPASHGCVRITYWDADWISKHLKLGMPIHVWDTTPAPAPPHITGRVAYSPNPFTSAFLNLSRDLTPDPTALPTHFNAISNFFR